MHSVKLSNWPVVNRNAARNFKRGGLTVIDGYGCKMG